MRSISRKILRPQREDVPQRSRQKTAVSGKARLPPVLRKVPMRIPSQTQIPSEAAACGTCYPTHAPRGPWLTLRCLEEPETAAALKRTLEALMDRGAVVRNLENLGERALPYKMSAHSQRHTRGGYFLVDFYAPTTTVESIMEHLSRDTDVIRPNVVKHPLTQKVKECEGMVPVPLEEKLYSTKKRK
ncbi:small ribosomal subunit protein bS6m isoform 1-T1 [Dama dama]